MAKLKDIFPKWMLKERSYGELEVGGSFAHLAEDADNEALVSDWAFVSGDVDGEAPAVGVYGSAGFLYAISPSAETSALGLSVVGDAQNRLNVKADGSFHWGDGTDASDNALGRFDANSVLFGTDRTGDGGGVWVYGDHGNVYLQNGADADHDWVNILSNNQHAIEFGRAGAGVVMRAPNGTPYNVTVNNAGAVIATAA